MNRNSSTDMKICKLAPQSGRDSLLKSARKSGLANRMMGLPTPWKVFAKLALCWEYANAAYLGCHLSIEMHWLPVLNAVVYQIIDYRHIPSHRINIILGKHIYHLGYSTTTWNIVIWIRRLTEILWNIMTRGFQLFRSVFSGAFVKHSFIIKEGVRGRKLVQD